jgi:hypothetical protein
MPGSTTTTALTRRNRAISQDNAPRLYLDFEGNKAGRLLLGCYRFAGETVRVVLDPDLAPAAEAKGLECMSPDAFVALVLQILKDNGAVIAAWSPHELKVIRTFGSLDDAGYDNLLARARKWVNRNGLRDEYLPPAKRRRTKPKMFRKDDWCLTRFAGWALGEKPQRGYASGKTTSRLGHVLDGLRRAGGYEGLTPVQKRKWADLLEHNRWDVEVLERVSTLLAQAPMLSELRQVRDPACLPA